MHFLLAPRLLQSARLRRRAIVVALLALLGAGLLPRLIAAQQPGGASAVLVNPCNGEVITLRDTSHLIPYVSSEQTGSRQAGLNAVGLSGVGSTGAYYLPMGTGKAVLTLGRGGIDIAAGVDLDLVSRAGQSPDFRMRSIGHLKLSVAGGFSGTGLTVRSQCGP